MNNIQSLTCLFDDLLKASKVTVVKRVKGKETEIGIGEGKQALKITEKKKEPSEDKPKVEKESSSPPKKEKPGEPIDDLAKEAEKRQQGISQRAQNLKQQGLEKRAQKQWAETVPKKKTLKEEERPGEPPKKATRSGAQIEGLEEAAQKFKEQKESHAKELKQQYQEHSKDLKNLVSDARHQFLDTTAKKQRAEVVGKHSGAPSTPSAQEAKVAQKIAPKKAAFEAKQQKLKAGKVTKPKVQPQQAAAPAAQPTVSPVATKLEHAAPTVAKKIKESSKKLGEVANKPAVHAPSSPSSLTSFNVNEARSRFASAKNYSKPSAGHLSTASTAHLMPAEERKYSASLSSVMDLMELAKALARGPSKASFKGSGAKLPSRGPSTRPTRQISPQPEMPTAKPLSSSGEVTGSTPKGSESLAPQLGTTPSTVSPESAGTKKPAGGAKASKEPKAFSPSRFMPSQEGVGDSSHQNWGNYHKDMAYRHGLQSQWHTDQGHHEAAQAHSDAAQAHHNALASHEEGYGGQKAIGHSSGAKAKTQLANEAGTKHFPQAAKPQKQTVTSFAPTPAFSEGHAIGSQMGAAAGGSPTGGPVPVLAGISYLGAKMQSAGIPRESLGYGTKGSRLIMPDTGAERNRKSLFLNHDLSNSIPFVRSGVRTIVPER